MGHTRNKATQNLGELCRGDHSHGQGKRKGRALALLDAEGPTELSREHGHQLQSE
jgi:hypothetical protein